MTVITEAPISITDLLDEHIAAIEEPRDPDGKWHPSSYWGACVRKIIYEVRGVEKTDPPGAKTRRVFRVGHILHSFVQGALATSPDILAIYPEFLIESKLEETGHGDALIYLTDGTVIVLEVKSIKASGFKFLKGQPKEENVAQGMTYAARARLNGAWVDDPIAPDGVRFIPPIGDRLTGVIVMYLEKESLDIREFWVPYDTEFDQKITARIGELEMYRADPESLPPRQKVKGKFPCSWNGGQCDFFTKCWDEDGPGVEPTEPTAVPGAFEW